MALYQLGYKSFTEIDYNLKFQHWLQSFSLNLRRRSLLVSSRVTTTEPNGC